MNLNTDQGELSTTDLFENSEQEFLMDGISMIYFENDTGNLVAFYFRCDGGAWEICQDILSTADLAPCALLEIHVGERPVSNCTVTYRWGNESKELSVPMGETAENWTPPAVKGEVFVGWYFGTEVFDFTSSIRENITLTAVYRKTEHKVSYFIDNTIWVSETFEYGTEIELKIPNEKTGFRFSGWKTVSGETVRNLTVTEDVRLDAVWVRTYKIMYFVNDVCVETQTYDENECSIAPSDPVMTGHHFLGWYHGGLAYAFGNAVTEDIRLMAKFAPEEITVTYYLDGEIVKTEKGFYGEKLVLDPVETEGYRFIGWETEQGEKITELILYKNICVYGKREKLKFTVIFDAGAGNFSEGKRHTEEVYYNETPTFQEIPTLEGHRFTGWDVDISCVKENITATAQYEILRFEISFQAHGEIFLTLNLEYGATLILPEAEGSAKPKEGARFSGWYDANGRLAQNGDTITQDLALMAMYEQICVTVSFFTDGKMIRGAEAVYGDRCVLPDAPDKEGCEFLYWSDTENGSAYEFGTSWKEKEDRNFHAVYAPKKYAIIYTGESVVFDGPDTGRYGERITFSAKAIEGYRITSVEMESADHVEILSENTFIMPAYEVRIHVRTELAIYQLEVWAEGTVYSVDCGAEFLPPIPEREGKIFLGWYRDSEYATEYDGVIAGAYGETIRLYAKFANARVKVTLSVGEATFVNTIDYGEHLQATDLTYELPTGYRVKGWRKDGAIWQEEFVETDFGLVAELERQTFRITFSAGDREECGIWEYGQIPQPSFVPWQEEESMRFLKWSPEITPATCDAEYTALYETVYWKIYVDEDREIYRERASIRESNAPTLAKEGHTFTGYLLDRQENDRLYYHAQYIVNHYAVRLDVADGAEIHCEKGSYRYGETVEITATVAEGYRALGWEINAGNDKEEISGGICFSMPAHDVTVKLETEEKEVVARLISQNNDFYKVDENWENVAAHLNGNAELSVSTLEAEALPERMQRSGNMIGGINIALWDVTNKDKAEVGFANGSYLTVKFKLENYPQEKLYLFRSGENEDISQSVILSEENGEVYALAKIYAAGDYYLMAEKETAQQAPIGWIAGVAVLGIACIGLVVIICRRRFR